MKHARSISGRSLALVSAGSALQPARAGTTNDGLTGGILVMSSVGAAIGAFDAPWAQDATGQQVKTSYEINGTKVVQTADLDSRTLYPVTLNAPVYSTMSTIRRSVRCMTIAPARLMSFRCLSPTMQIGQRLSWRVATEHHYRPRDRYRRVRSGLERLRTRN